MTDCDVAIIGAGPAGATASLLLARAGASVALFERARLPRRRPLCGWVNQQVATLLGEIDPSLRAVAGPATNDIRFFSSDFSQECQPSDDAGQVLLIKSADLDARLIDAAGDSGVLIHDDTNVTKIEPGEDVMTIFTENGGATTARRVILATGSGAELLTDVTIAAPRNTHAVTWAHVESRIAQPHAHPRLSLVIDPARRRHFCIAIDQPTGASATLYADGSESSGAERLATYCSMLSRAGRLSADVDVNSESVTILQGVASIAVEFDTHVGKHALVIGDAGGFQAQASLEGIYPAIWSARLAADVLLESLKAKHSQDALIEFDNRWRMEMAEYLRPPNTNMSLLMPLVFSNQSMADRMTAAFFTGQNL